MADLYLLFFIVGVILFAAVVAYSLYQQKKRNARASEYETNTVSADLGAEPRVEPSLSATDDHNVSADSAEMSADYVSTVPKVTEKSSDRAALQSSMPKLNSVTDAESANLASNQDTLASDTMNNRPYSLAMDKAKSAVARIKQSAAPKVGSRPKAVEATQKTPIDDGKIAPSLADDESVESELSAITSSAEQKTTTVFSDGGSVITDLVARVLNPKPIEQSELLSLFREHDYKFNRKVHVYGLNELTDMWRDIEFELPSARFLELGISIQLCDREGAMSAKESHDYQQMVLQFCEKFDAPFEFSLELDAALKQAQALDQVGRRYDSMAVLNVVPRSKSGFRVADIQSCARDLLMSTDRNGIFMKTEGQKNNITVLYRLACTDGEGHFGVRSVGQAAATSVYDLVVYMNVPATRDPEIVFQQMVKDANDLATWLDGKVVDRSGKAMTQRTYSTLMQQISDIAYSMQQDGLVPGDSVAKKLF